MDIVLGRKTAQIFFHQVNKTVDRRDGGQWRPMKVFEAVNEVGPIIVTKNMHSDFVSLGFYCLGPTWVYASLCEEETTLLCCLCIIM